MTTLAVSMGRQTATVLITLRVMPALSRSERNTGNTELDFRPILICGSSGCPRPGRRGAGRAIAWLAVVLAAGSSAAAASVVQPRGFDSAAVAAAIAQARPGDTVRLPEGPSS